MTQMLLSNGTPLSPRPTFWFQLTHTLSISYKYIYAYAVGWLANSYAVPKEVGKVGVESPTFIEPVQKRKDGIEAMFSRQTKAAQQGTSRDTPLTAVAAGSGKRKRESSLCTEEKEEKETGAPVSTPAPSSPAKRPKVKKDPIKHEDTVDSEEGNSDIEILLSGPSSPPPSQQSVGHPTWLTFPFLTYEM